MRILQPKRSAAARKLFIASVIYLPLLLGVMVIDRVTASPLDSFSAPAVSVLPVVTESID